MENSDVNPDELIHQEVDSLSDYNNLPVKERLRLKNWDARLSGYTELLQTADGVLLFDVVSESPSLFLEEVTVRGQEYSLKCILQWTRGVVSVTGPLENKLIQGCLLKYGSSSQSRIKELVDEVFMNIGERFGPSRAIAFVNKALNESCKFMMGPVIRDPTARPVAKGSISRQIIGCLHVLSTLASKYECDMDATLPKVVDLLNSSTVDRSLKDACYSFLSEMHAVLGDNRIDSLNLNDAQAKELRSRIFKPSPTPSTDDTVIISCSLEGFSSVPPEDLLKRVPKNWFEIIETAAKWQEKRDAWTVLSKALARPIPGPIPDEILRAITKTLKTESNVPVTAEVCTAICSLGNTMSRSSAVSVLSALIPRLKDKTPSVQRSVRKAIVCMKSFIDARIIEVELKGLLTSSRKDVCNIVQDLLPLPGCELCVLNHILLPSFDESDIPTRDLVVAITKSVIADVTTSCGPLEECIALIQRGLADLSPARKKVLESALGISAPALARPKSGSSLPSVSRFVQRPRTASSHASLTLSLESPLGASVQTLVVAIKPSVSEARTRRQTAEKNEKWLSVGELVSSETLARLSGQLRSVLMPGSEKIIAMMTNTGRLVDILKSVDLWQDAVRDTREWTEIADLLFKWLVAVLVASRDNSQICSAVLALVEAMVCGISREFSDRECSIFLPVLVEKIPNPSFADRIVTILESPVVPIQQRVGALCSTITKTRSKKTSQECLKRLISWLRDKILPPRLKRMEIARTLLYALADKACADLVTVDLILEIADSELSSCITSLLRTDSSLKDASRHSLLKRLSLQETIRSPRPALSDRTNVSVVPTAKATSRTSVRPLTEAPAIVNPAVQALANAVSNGESLVESCSQIQDLLDSFPQEASSSAPTIITSITRVVRAVLVSTDSMSRQSLLSLLHVVSRTAGMWHRISKAVLEPFIRELLTAISDKTLRSTEPDIWSDLNLSLVHAIANSERPVAYSALLDLSRSDPAMKVLAIRCVEKINRSLPQYLEDLDKGENNKNALLSSFQRHIHQLALSVGEQAVIEDECVQTCLRGICSVVGLVEVGEFVGLKVGSPEERLLWKKLLKCYSANEKRRKSLDSL